MLDVAQPGDDVVIHEIGGTVGDIESQPFLEAARQVRHDIGRENTFYIHVSLVPYIGPSHELKTKPTQHSVAALRSVGIQPDALVCRSAMDLPEGHTYRVEVLDTWEMTRETVLTGVSGHTVVPMPGKPWMAAVAFRED